MGSAPAFPERSEQEPPLSGWPGAPVPRRRGGCWDAQAGSARSGPTSSPGQGPSGGPLRAAPPYPSPAHVLPTRSRGVPAPLPGIREGWAGGRCGSDCVCLCLSRSRKCRSRLLRTGRRRGPRRPRGFLHAAPGAPDTARPFFSSSRRLLCGRGGGRRAPLAMGLAPRAAAPRSGGVKAARSLRRPRREPGPSHRPALPGCPEPGVVCHFEEKKPHKNNKTKTLTLPPPQAVPEVTLSQS